MLRIAAPLSVRRGVVERTGCFRKCAWEPSVVVGVTDAWMRCTTHPSALTLSVPCTVSYRLLMCQCGVLQPCCSLAGCERTGRRRKRSGHRYETAENHHLNAPDVAVDMMVQRLQYCVIDGGQCVKHVTPPVVGHHVTPLVVLCCVPSHFPFVSFASHICSFLFHAPCSSTKPGATLLLSRG